MPFGSRVPTVAATVTVICSLDTALAKKPLSAPRPPSLPESPTVDTASHESAEAFAAALTAAQREHSAVIIRAERQYRATLIAWANECGFSEFDLRDLANAAMRVQYEYAKAIEDRERRYAYWRTGSLDHLGDLIEGVKPYEWTLHLPTPETLALYLDAQPQTTTAQYKANRDLVARCLVSVSGDFAADGFPAPSIVDGHVAPDWVALVPIAWITELASMLIRSTRVDANEKKD